MVRKRNGAEYARQALLSINDQFARLPILARGRSIAIYNLVAAADLDALRSHAMHPNSGLHGSHRRIIESGAHIIPYIYRNCAEGPFDGEGLREETFIEAQLAYEFAHKFESIAYAYELADRGHFRIYVANKDPRITFAYTNADADRADSHLRASEVLGIAAPAGNAPEIDDLTAELRPRVRAIRRDRCDYEYSDLLVQMAGEYGRQKLARTNRLQFPEDIAIGDLTVRDLHTFWAALMALSDIHTLAHWIGDDGRLDDLPINTIVLSKRRPEFIGLFARISGLAEATVNNIVRVFTYDLAIADRVPILQPFLPISNDRLCLPSSFVNGNSFERNFRKLLHHHPGLRVFAADFESHLEPSALRSLAKLFPKPRYLTLIQFQIHNVTDIDLLVFDLEAGFALVVQHKWLISPDTLKESISNDEGLSRGAEQAIRSCQYLRDHLDDLRPRIGLLRAQQINSIHGVVVSRGLEPTGFCPINPDIPIVTERAFIELTEQSDGLPGLWQLLTARPDHRRAAAAAADVKSIVSLGGYDFVLPGMAIVL